jgi:hypothetical protein
MTDAAMIVEKELKNLLNELSRRNVAEIKLGGSSIMVHVFDQSSKFSLSTPVYMGGNFIPKSVRTCLTKDPPFTRNHLKSYLTVDENKFQIILNYLGGVANINKRTFINLLEEFSWLADEWRLYLDEHDKTDLIHVRTK